MKVKMRSLLYLVLVPLLLVVGCSRSEPTGDRVEIIAFVDSLTDVSEILGTSKEINDYDVGIRFYVIDVFISPKLATAYGIESVPDFVILVDGVFLMQVDTLDGACAVAVSEAIRLQREGKDEKWRTY